MRSLREGHLVIAIYPVDNNLYRAKIEKVIQENRTGMDSSPTFRVRYLDYGNTCDVTKTHLYIWDEVLEIIPAQAVSCKLDTMMIFTKRIQAKEFTDFLKQSNPISIQVQQVFRPRNGVLTARLFTRPQSSLLISLILRVSTLWRN